ncbi:hypothetical protein GTY84_13970 [Streptomyces sp. SID8352]|nr:hypothetical protein [Streptomyces sp. SID8352]
MTRIRLVFHRLFRRPAVTGPYPIYIRRLPTGAVLDMEDYLTAMLTTLADNADLLDLLDEMARDRAEARAHDGWEPEGLYVEQLLAALGYEIPVYGDRVVGLAERLLAVAPARAEGAPARSAAGAA